ncbi:Putative transcriptional regulator, PaaX family (fragment) [Verrucomicrobia bacterium]
MIVYDVPQTKASDRVRLRRTLAHVGFGFLQNSVWITPDPLADVKEALRIGPVDVESLIMLEGRPCAGETDEQVVTGAWDFAAINASYEEHAQVLGALPRQPLASSSEAERLRRWCHRERSAWQEAMNLDPLLPEPLHRPCTPQVTVVCRRGNGA